MSLGVVLVVLLNAFILAQALKNRTHLTMIEQGVAGAFQAIHTRLQEIADLPEALAGVGGVQLMPQKSFGEIAIEHIMGHMFGEKRLNAQPESAETWPQDEKLQQSPDPVEENPL